MAKRSSAITQAHLDSDLPIKTIVWETGDVFPIARQESGSSRTLCVLHRFARGRSVRQAPFGWHGGERFTPKVYQG
jgi:hypothetical protein